MLLFALFVVESAVAAWLSLISHANRAEALSVDIRAVVGAKQGPWACRAKRLAIRWSWARSLFSGEVSSFRKR